MQRNKVIAGNWKMHKTVPESVEFVNNLKNKLLDDSPVDVILCAPFVSLFQMNETRAGSNIGLGAENMYWEESGAYTGEISPEMLVSTGCDYVILGHSERRQIFSETNETVGKKVRAALKHDLKPIVCIGETLEEREANRVEEVLDQQLSGAIENLTGQNQIDEIILAYEPVWAIGTGVNATPDQAVEAHQFIRGWLDSNIQDGAGQQMTILYGGSMKPANAQSLLENSDIDGGLIGGASLDVEKFSELVSIATDLS
ncbi:MAG: triose-phosphate isomerase [Candidatus Marinimicrobia bacterium]|nr:triose-phosphate isomerase [Candidatus Neomarinimicrobiota bacterium]MCF7880274.1 triose-phosphate isomerase [Candidatus Neomarinimicrobiota bacterium]